MATSDFQCTLLSDQTPQAVFQTILQVRDWWSGFYAEEIEGETGKPNSEFSYTAAGGAHFSRQKLVELIPYKKIVWLVTDSKLSFLENMDEWTGTKLIFDISVVEGHTQVVFTHQGLTPDIECYSSCSPAWEGYLKQKLLPLLNAKKESFS